MIGGRDDMTIQWYPGHMAKAKRNMVADLNLVDIIIEVIDARIPLSSRNPDLDRIVAKKPRLLVLNKKDLAEEKITQYWLDYYAKQGFGVVAVNGAQKQGIRDLLAAAQKLSEPIWQEMERKGRLRRAIRSMVVGSPNTGKSTIINALAPRAIAKTGNKPGVTKGTQWIKTQNNIELLDTPGVLWPKFTDERVGFRLAVTGAISDLVFSQEDIAIELLKWILTVNPEAIKERYKIDTLEQLPELVLEQIAQKRGLLGAGGMVKTEPAAILLLNEFHNGKIGRFSLDRPGDENILNHIGNSESK